jgi:aminomethyltransferase
MNSSNTATPQATPLKDEHIKLGAKMVDFAGWYMPVEYFGIRAEHLHVREHVGLFDVSHMGEIRVQGEKALSTLQWLTSNDVSKIENGQAQYGLLTNEKGGVVDDLIIYCLDKNKDYLVCVNAANTEKDWQWFQKHNRGAKLSNESSKWGQIAVQGPQAIALVADIFSSNVKEIEIFKFGAFKFSGVECLLARTGYTGEHGFEIFVPADKTVELWRTLLQKGEKYQARAIGLGARDTLRTEMKYSLYGQEIDDTTNPYEALLGWAVKPDAKDFVGRDNVMAVKSAGMKRKLIGFKMVDKGIARHDYKVVGIDKQEIGKVTSGTVSPSLNENIGIAYVSTDFSQIGKEIFIDIRGRLAKAVVVETPFVKSGLVKSKS